MSKLKNLSDGIVGKGNKEYINLYPPVPITRKGVVAFLYMVFAAAFIYSVVLMFTGSLTLGVLILVTTILNAFFAIRDANKSKWGDEFEG
jgi:hypothetical protein